MKKILLTLIFLVILTSGCSTTPFKKRNMALESGVYAKAYREGVEAKNNNNLKLSCNLFTKLKENDSFELKELALIYVIGTCDLSKNGLISLWKKSVIPTYLREFYLLESLKIASIKKMPEFEEQFSFDLIPFQKSKAKKISLLQNAIIIAKERKDLLSLKKYTDLLIELSPSRNSEITNQNIAIVAKDFESNREFDKARALYEQIIKNSDFSILEKFKIYNAYRTSFKIERNLKEFLVKTYEMEAYLKNELEKDPENLQKNELWVDSKINLARAVWTDHQSDLALKLLTEIMPNPRARPNQQALIYHTYGSIQLENKKIKEALKSFEKADSFKTDDLSMQENIQWAIIWNKYLLHKNDELIEYANSLVNKSKNLNFILKLNFWKAKALKKMGHSDLANETFQSIIESDPFSYYGIISCIELKIPLPILRPKKEETKLSGFSTLDWLLEVKETEIAMSYLKEINSQFKTLKERENAMPLYLKTGWFQGGMRQIVYFSTKDRNAFTAKYIDIIFPRPYLEIIEKASSKYKIPPELIYAIMRQESAFVASERSWADAFGLMQMTPEKANQLSRKFKIPYKDYSDLYAPITNIEMGAALLKELSENFKFHFAQTVAAYNAGKKVVSDWEKTRFNGNYFEFIEMIPYEETRNYIKLVFRNYMIYKQESSSLPISFNNDFFSKPFIE